MALNAYLKLSGANQGVIKGSVVQKGREDSIMVIAYDHKITLPLAAQTGQAPQKPIHGNLEILKEVDKSTPLLMKALTTCEPITSWELHFWQPTAAGKEEQYFTIKLQDALIVEIKQEMLNNKYPENMQLKVSELVIFRYKNISWTYEPDKMTTDATA